MKHRCRYSDINASLMSFAYESAMQNFAVKVPISGHLRHLSEGFLSDLIRMMR
jgi:hypothetical protein